MTLAPKDNATTTKLVNATNPIVRLLQGIRIAPALVAMARGLLAAVVVAAGGAAIVYIGGIDFTVLGLPQVVSILIGPGLIYAIRQIEGLIDEKIDPNQNRLPPPAAP
jgi:hypothetical protein